MPFDAAITVYASRPRLLDVGHRLFGDGLLTGVSLMASVTLPRDQAFGLFTPAGRGARRTLLGSLHNYVVL